MGLRFTTPLVLTSTTRTNPSLPGYTASIHPSLQSRLGVSGSITNTKSPTVRFFDGWSHFGRDPIPGKYSHIQRLHTLQISSCIRLHRLCTLTADLSTVSGASSPPIWPIKKWFGLNVVSSLTSPLTMARGLKFKISRLL